MERTVPSTESEEIELYLRTIYSLLRSTARVRIRTLEEVHMGIHSPLHSGAREPQPDMSAFIYSMLRLPSVVSEINLVVLGQSASVFERGGFGDVFTWQEVSAPARRRRSFYDGAQTMAAFIASRSDIDDIVPALTAYQIEWNKIHLNLIDLPEEVDIADLCSSVQGCEELAGRIGISLEDFDRLYAIWDVQLGDFLYKISRAPLDLSLQLLNGSVTEYRRATHSWWNNIEASSPELDDRPVYFISSNTHSLPNILTGFALQNQAELVDYLHESGNAGLLREWEDIQGQQTLSNRENFLYYVLKKYQQSPRGKELVARQAECERESGITRVPSRRYFDVEAQVIDLSRLDPQQFDPRLKAQLPFTDGLLNSSDAMIVNIDYPLGVAAYNILTEVSEHVGSVLGVYVMGKAATLNGVIGDVMIPNVVHDEHSQNTYLFPNCFWASNVAPYLVFGTVLDNQKAVTVQGTFLQNDDFMDVFYREGYTDIEMESGPFLSAIYEMFRPTRHPVNEIVNLYGIPFDLGLVHYASDTPRSKGKNLGAGSLSYFGMDSTYAASLAILKRIFDQEKQRLSKETQ